MRTTRKAFLLSPTLEGNGSLTLFSAPFPRARNSPPLSVLRSATAKVLRRKGGPFGAHEGGKKEAQFFFPLPLPTSPLSLIVCFVGPLFLAFHGSGVSLYCTARLLFSSSPLPSQQERPSSFSLIPESSTKNQKSNPPPFSDLLSPPFHLEKTREEEEEELCRRQLHPPPQKISPLPLIHRHD